ncbi:MAG: redoxin domain-containing protein [Bacteroidetes bacterium]|nr:redoxin domain-containing protein [Bacteroidota bacterium]MBS1540284.1 redoxin domain-containing protein [Bacteroidota bacterium]
MKRYIAFWIFCFAVFGFTVVRAQSKPTPNEYPMMKLIEFTDFAHAARDLTGKNILILYLPDCDHCQREGAAIAQHAAAFKNYQVWFISTATHENNWKFAQTYKLAANKNFHFVRTEAEDIFHSLGSIPTPSVYIFNEAKKLVRSFKGETKIEEILKAL